MYDGDAIWSEVDHFLTGRLVAEDCALVAARESSAATNMPHADVSPAQGAFLGIVARIAGARRVLEFGTLAGYSTIWLARAVGPTGKVVTLEVDPVAAQLAAENFDRAGVADRVDLVLGPAVESVRGLVAAGAAPFDLVFIDADKSNNPAYLDAALALSRPGTVIIGDNVVRNGAVIDSESSDPRVQGTRTMIEALGRDDRVLATAVQTVGVKGWDGFVIARVERPAIADS